MKRFVVLFLLVFSFHTGIAQITARQAYDSGQFLLADSLFATMDGDEAKLFRAKSKFALSKYHSALSILHGISSDDENIISESIYTKALTLVQLGSYSDALNALEFLEKKFEGHNISLEAKKLRSEVLGFITLEEATRILKSSVSDDMKASVLEGVVQNYGTKSSASLLEYAKIIGDVNPEVGQKYKNILADTVFFQKARGLARPTDYAYTVAVAFPVFEETSPIFDITRGMYNGLLMAIEQHNNKDSFKIFPVFVNTNTETTTQEELAAQTMLEYNPALILGPLFSNDAVMWSKIADQLEVPLFLPLANSGEIAPFNEKVFQFNPTFEIRGRAMADFARRKGFDTLAVVAEEGSLGMDEALGFIDAAERNQAELNYSFVVDLKKRSYNTADFTKYLIEPNEELRDSLDYLPVEAAFFPISGQIAPTMAELILTDLEAQKSDVIILGSEEWSRTQIPKSRLSKFEIYYSTAFAVKQGSEVSEFESSYMQRFGYAHNEYSHFGYDLGRYIIYALNESVNPLQISKVVPFLKKFNGLSLDVDFKETRINHAVRIKKL